MTDRAIIEALADFLETPQNSLCACQAVRHALLAYLHGEDAPEVIISAPRCHSCDVVAQVLARCISQDQFGYMELAARHVEGDDLAEAFNLLLDQPLPEVTQ